MTRSPPDYRIGQLVYLRAPHTHEGPYVISSVCYDPSVLPTYKYTLCYQDGASVNNLEQYQEYMLEAVMEYEKRVASSSSDESSSEHLSQLPLPLSESLQPLLTTQSTVYGIEEVPGDMKTTQSQFDVLTALSGSNDETVQIWDAEDRTLLRSKKTADRPPSKNKEQSTPLDPVPALKFISWKDKTSPREEEVSFYYHGLPSRPKLVARSSDFQWHRQFQDEHETRKVLRNVGDHPIVDQYNNKVIKDIINTLGDLEWNAIDVLRIGYDFEDPTTYPIILWVSVQPGSTTWERGYQCAMSCTAVLRQHNITDVECEIKEAEFFCLTRPQLLKLGIQDSCSDHCIPFTQTLGQSISCYDQLETEGSIGLYLKQNNGDKIFALTCRHCIWSGPKDEHTAYTSLYNSSKPKTGQRLLKIIQPGDNTFNIRKETIERYIRIWSKKGECQSDSATANKELQSLGETNLILERFRARDDRVIGHVFFSLPRDLHPDKWLRDWALIELDIEKFDVSSLTNMVYIDQIPEDIRLKLGTDPRFHLKIGPNMSLKLKKVVIPVSEMKNPKMIDEDSEKCLIVGKRGRTSKVTWGTANEVKSVTRTRSVRGDLISLEWCVLSTISTPFSRLGDSGSVVFDLLGRIGGIMTGGVGLNDTTDTTYVTPMEWLLEDINKELEERFEMTVYIL